MERSDGARRAGPAFSTLASVLLLVVGVEFWLVLGEGDYGTTRQRWLLVAVLIAGLIPPVSGFLSRQLDRLRTPAPKSRMIIAALVALLSAGYFLLSAHLQKRSLSLQFVDESSYAIGAQMAARFHLWMPQHPEADFFEALELIVKPVYASIYFPGTAILYAPAVWLHLPWWSISVLTAGACVGLTYRVVAELIDSLAGLLCALMLAGTSIFRLASVMMLSGMPVLLMALLAIYAWLRWRKNRDTRWAMAMGLFGALAAFTRPLDAAALLAPLGLAVILDIRHDSRGLARTIAAIASAAAPVLLIQVVFNIGVTGSPFRTPFQVGLAQDYPQTEFGFHGYDPAIRPHSSLPQKQAHYQEVTVPALKAHRLDYHLQASLNDWLAKLLNRGVPQALLLILVPCGWLAWRSKRWVLTATFPLWVALYAFYVFKFPHYFVPMVPMVAFTIVCGIEQLRTSASNWPAIAHAVAVTGVGCLVVLSITAMPEFSGRWQRDQWFDFGELDEITSALKALPHKPAVVLFRYDHSSSSEVEPVYNTDVAWPDDAPVIRAHDLGVRNIEIFQYYAKRQPDRAFYLYDRGDHSLRFLGDARDLGHAN